jgi:hypothetical protein
MGFLLSSSAFSLSSFNLTFFFLFSPITFVISFCPYVLQIGFCVSFWSHVLQIAFCVCAVYFCKLLLFVTVHLTFRTLNPTNILSSFCLRSTKHFNLLQKWYYNKFFLHNLGKLDRFTHFLFIFKYEIRNKTSCTYFEVDIFSQN